MLYEKTCIPSVRVKQRGTACIRCKIYLRKRPIDKWENPRKVAADLLGVTLWDEHKGSKKIKKILNANIGDESTVQRNKTKKKKKVQHLPLFQPNIKITFCFVLGSFLFFPVLVVLPLAHERKSSVHWLSKMLCLTRREKDLGVKHCIKIPKLEYKFERKEY